MGKEKKKTNTIKKATTKKTTKKVNAKKITNKKNKKGFAFTLIELLAVIVILGILLLVAIPSVTNYINNSRKSAYIDTANQYIKGVTVLVNSGVLDVYDTGTTYYVPTSCVSLETGGESPYGGKFDPAYVVVTYDNDSYSYYWISRDGQGMGIDKVTLSNNLTSDLVKAGVKKDVVSAKYGIDGRNQIILFSEDCSSNIPGEASVPINGSTGNEILKLCIRAKAETLHAETCTNSSMSGRYCRYGGYSLGSTITYGNQTYTEGELHSGDAFDCDVNGDGVHDPNTERFYFVSDYFDTHTKTFDSTYAVLIHYTDYYNGAPSHTPAEYVSYNYANRNHLGRFVNWLGPVTAIENLPTTSTWKNVSLKTTTRAILSDSYSTHNSNNVPHGPLPTDFDYSGYAARLLTVPELRQACNIGYMTLGGSFKNSLVNCNYVFEGTKFASNDAANYGSWLETSCTSHSQDAWYLNASFVGITSNTAEATNGIRPAIDVNKNDIDY